MPWVLGLVLKAWQFRVISLRRCLCKNFLTERNFKAGSWISESKAKNLALTLQWIKKLEATSSLKDLTNPKSITGRGYTRIWRIGFDDGGRIEIVLQYYLFDLRNYPSVEPWQVKKGEKLSHGAEVWRMFSAEDNWVLFSPEDNWVLFKKRRL